MGSTKNVKILPFDEGPPKFMVLFCSSLECLPFDCGPNQVLTLCHINENLTLKVICCLNINSAHDPNSKMSSPSNVNNDSILMNNLYCLLNAIPFDGCSVICVPRSHTDIVVDGLDHGEENTELHIECTSECTELCIHSFVVQIKEITLSMLRMLISMSWESVMLLQQVVLPTPTRDLLFSVCGTMHLLVWVNPFILCYRWSLLQ